MARDHALMYVLSAIIVLNIIAIILLQNRVAEQGPVQETPDLQSQPVVIRPDRPDVRVLLLEPDCEECFDISMYLTALNDTIDMQVESAPPAQFSDRLPALAFNSTLELYPDLVKGWEQVGTIVQIPTGRYAGKWYVLPTQTPPYVENGTVRGRVEVTYLVMASCTECYSVAVLRDELAAVQIVPYKEQTIDVSSSAGRELVRRYNITAVPTVIMSKEASLYPIAGWEVIGTIENGNYVLRNLQRMKVPYYDLALERLMNP